MIHFAYPNVNITNNEFWGCGRYIALLPAEAGEYKLANPKLKNITELFETVSILASDSIRAKRKIYQIKDRYEKPYTGESQSLAYLLALISRSAELRIRCDTDIWCTGHVRIAEGKRPCLSPVNMDEFRIKLRAFLSEQENKTGDTLFIVPEANIDDPLNEELLEKNDAIVISLNKFKMLKDRGIQKKTILLVSPFDLPILRDTIFYQPVIHQKKPAWIGIGKFVATATLIVIFSVIAYRFSSKIRWFSRQANADTEKSYQIEAKTGMEFLHIPSGCYDMGCDDRKDKNCADCETPLHQVCISDFMISRYEVTQGQWKKIMPDKPSEYPTCGEDCPAVMVSWKDAAEFLMRLNKKTGKHFRLPTEAEWEYVCKMGIRSHIDTPAPSVQPVRDTESDASGIHGMSGNVSEWCGDAFSENAYAEHNLNNPFINNGENRVIRGGSWRYPADSPCTFRLGRSAEKQSGDTGFRVVMMR